MSTATTHIEIRNNRAGQARAYVGKSRTRVLDIYALSELHGDTPDGIAEAYPHLTMGEIHAALFYLAENRAEIIRQLEEEQAIVREYRALTGPGPLETLMSQDEPGSESLSP